jgi:glutamate synthase domain-containing protein 1
MCGIAGIIYRDGADTVGRDMARMLQSMKHRGPDSTGYALYGPPADGYVMRVKLAERGHSVRDFEYDDRLRRNRRLVEDGLESVGARVHRAEETARGEGSEHVLQLSFDYDGDLQTLADRIEAVRGVEVLSLGHSLEIIKDLGDARTVADSYQLEGYRGTHAIGHVRMATESDVDIANAHPYWAYPYSDVAVVHNGQLTNYFEWRRRLERKDRRFQSECDSEIIAVYLADKMSEGASLEDAMRQSLEDLDGVFTYICVTEDELGMAKDELAAKPLVLYEGDDMVALASEEIAIRAVIDREIETYDPFEGEVMVWKR